MTDLIHQSLQAKESCTSVVASLAATPPYNTNLHFLPF